MLTIHEGIVFFAILIGMREGYFDVLSFQMHNVVKPFGSHVVLQQVLQAMTGKDFLTVINKGQPRIQVSIVTEQGFNKLILELIAHKERIVRLEEDGCSGFFRGVFGHIAYQPTFLESRPTHLSVTETRHFETAAQGIHRLDTNPIQTDTLLERLGIVLTTGIQLTDRLNELALRNTPAIVADAHTKIVFDGHFNLLSGSHLELVDAVVHHFLQEDVDTVIVLLSVTQPADVHTRTDTDVFHVVEVTDVVVGIFYGGFYQFVVFFHGIVSLLQIFFISPTTLMLYGLEIFPLCLHLAVFFQFRIALGILETELLIHRNQVIE